MINKIFNFENIKMYLPKNAIILGNISLVNFSKVGSTENIDEDTLDWINSSAKNKAELLKNSKAKTIICDRSITVPKNTTNDKCIIQVDEPKLVFSRLVNALFVKNIDRGIHKTAYLSDRAKIGENVTIGAFSYIGDAKIGDNTIISDNCSIKDGVEIGMNVYIDSNTVIGSEGFGYIKNELGQFEKFPHVYGVIIEDEVEIGANTTIDRGSLKPTVIGYGVKIDNLVHIAHNVHIGKNSAIIANAMIAGSTKIGENCWIAPSSSILEHINIGNNVTVGVGAIVTKDIPDNEVWTGSPARPIKDFVKIQKKLKEVL